MHPLWRRLWLTTLSRGAWAAVLSVVALAVVVVLAGMPTSPKPSGLPLFQDPTIQPTKLEQPYQARPGMPPGLYYPINYLQQQPRRWVGQTVQISAGLYQIGNIPAEMPFVGPHGSYFPPVRPNATTPFAILLDGDDPASLLPLAPGVPLPAMVTQGSGTGGEYRVHLVWWPHCGPLGFGHRACLVADQLQILP